MPFPKQTLTVRDPGIGVSSQAARIPIYSGIAHGGSGAVNTLLSIGDISQVRSVIGYGPLAEDVALHLQRNGGPVYAVIHNSAQDVSLSASVLNASGSVSPPAVTVSGSPNERYALRVEIVAGGVRGTATFRYSLDAHDADYAPYTWSQVRPTAATYAIPNTGLTLAFPTGTYVAADVYTKACVPQEPGTTDLATVATLLQNTPALDFHLWNLSGAQPDETTGSAVAAAMSGHLTSLTNSFRYVRGILDVGSDDTADNVYAEAANWTSARICPAYGYVLRQSALPFEGFTYRKASTASGLAVRAAGSLISTDMARAADGPDEGVKKIYFDGFYDQRLDGVKISTMRTYPGGVAGFYFANGKLKSAFGSDFTDLQFGRVMDVACRTTYVAQFPFLSESFRTITGGYIDPRDAASVEQSVGDKLADALLRQDNARGIPGHVSSVTYLVDLLHNLLTTGQMKTSVGIRPLGYAKEINTTLFFTLN